VTDVLIGTDAAGTDADDEIDGDLVCRGVIPITHDVTSFVLASPNGRRFRFDAGQYVTVAAVVDGQPVERCYTISSPSTRTDDVTITVKRVPGGPMSNWLHDRFAVGDRVHVSGPLGRFTQVEHPAPKYLFLSAGSGITPLMSMTRTLLDDPTTDVAFVHSARSPIDIIFRTELDDIAGSGGGVQVAAICEHDTPHERWSGPRGRLTAELLIALVPDLADREILTCGPQPYMDAVRGMLRDAGVDPARCHEESYVFGGVSLEPAGAGSSSLRTGFSVEFRRSGRVIACPPGDSVLQAGLRAGVALPSSCGEGMCGTCKHPMLAGQVDMHHNGGIRPREIAQGQILLCCSTPLDDLVIDA
jgi:ferredoxin-NADP reductase